MPCGSWSADAKGRVLDEANRGTAGVGSWCGDAEPGQDRVGHGVGPFGGSGRGVQVLGPPGDVGHRVGQGVQSAGGGDDAGHRFGFDFFQWPGRIGPVLVITQDVRELMGKGPGWSIRKFIRLPAATGPSRSRPAPTPSPPPNPYPATSAKPSKPSAEPADVRTNLSQLGAT